MERRRDVSAFAAMSQAKLHNEMQLLDLARHLRQERLLIASERQNLQTLNQKVSVVCTCLREGRSGMMLTLDDGNLLVYLVSN